MTQASGTQLSEIVVRVGVQKLFYYERGKLLKSYDVSTAKRGVGNQRGSQKTPLGRHKIAVKIGAGKPIGEIFVARQALNQIARIYTQPTDLEHDRILTRILWLQGLEPGFNRDGLVDTMRRYIYIHGTDEEGLIGTPASDGCVRMRNADVVELFDWVEEGTLVTIEN